MGMSFSGKTAASKTAIRRSIRRIPAYHNRIRGHSCRVNACALSNEQCVALVGAPTPTLATSNRNVRRPI